MILFDVNQVTVKKDGQAIITLSTPKRFCTVHELVISDFNGNVQIQFVHNASESSRQVLRLQSCDLIQHSSDRFGITKVCPLG